MGNKLVPLSKAFDASLSRLMAKSRVEEEREALDFKTRS